MAADQQIRNFFLLLLQLSTLHNKQTNEKVLSGVLVCSIALMLYTMWKLLSANGSFSKSPAMQLG